MRLPSRNFIEGNLAGFKKSKNKQQGKIFRDNLVHSYKIYLTRDELMKLEILAKKFYLSKSAFVRFLINGFCNEDIKSGAKKEPTIWENLFQQFIDKIS
jgi:hypothetical protein